MKIIFDCVADFQNLGFKIPRVQRNAQPKYKPIRALKTFFSSMVYGEISNNISGQKPYKIAIGTTIITEIIR